jgi:hypothetical protein
MKRLKQGPNIDLKKLKVPKIGSELYQQLKGSHLLPVVALLVAGLIAIPLLLGGSSSSPSGTTETGSANDAANSAPAELAVTKYTPGLREFDRRLTHRRPTDPFRSSSPAKNKSTSPSGGGEAEETAPTGAEEPTSEGGAGSGEESSGGTREGEEEGGPGPNEGAQSAPSSDTIEVEVTAIQEGPEKPTPQIRAHLKPSTKLPADGIPALTYTGPSADRKKALMAVSPEVSALLGESKCIVSAKPCQLLALEVGAPETVVFGPHGKTYRIELLKVGEETAPGIRPSQDALGQAQVVVGS